MANPFQSVITQLQNTVRAINAITTTINGALAKIWAAFVAVPLTDAASVAIDMSAGINFSLQATFVVGPTRQLANPTNAKVGQRGYIVTTNGSAGTIWTYGSQYQAAGGVASLAPATGAGQVNLFQYVVLPGPIVFLSVAANVEH